MGGKEGRGINVIGQSDLALIMAWLRGFLKVRLLHYVRNDERRGRFGTKKKRGEMSVSSRLCETIAKNSIGPTGVLPIAREVLFKLPNRKLTFSAGRQKVHAPFKNDGVVRSAAGDNETAWRPETG